MNAVLTPVLLSTRRPIDPELSEFLKDELPTGSLAALLLTVRSPPPSSDHLAPRSLLAGALGLGGLLHSRSPVRRMLRQGP